LRYGILPLGPDPWTALCRPERGRTSNRAERRGGLARTVRLDRFNEERENPLALQATGLNDGEDPLRESGATLTARAEAPLSPEDALSQNALGVVVRRFYPFAAKECPECRFQVEEVLAKGGRLVIVDLGTTFHENLEILPDPSHRMLESRPIDSSRLEVIPDREEVTCELFGFMSDLGRLTSSIDQLLEIPGQMSPADLAEPEGATAVGLPAVAGEDPTVNSPQESLEPAETTVSMDHEVSHHGGAGGPHPGCLVTILPARLVEILGLSLPYCFASLLVRRFECLGDLGLHVGDRAQGDAVGNFKDVLEDLLRLTPADLSGPAEEGGQGSESGAEGSVEHSLGDHPVVHVTATTAGYREALVLRHLARLRRKVRNLVTNRWLCVGSRLGKGCVADRAFLRDVGDEVIHLVGRKKTAILPLVTKLTAGIAPAGRFGVGPRSMRRIGGRWLVGVPGILTKSFLEAFDPLVCRFEELLKGGSDCFQLRHSRRELRAVRAGRTCRFRALHSLHADIIGRKDRGLYRNSERAAPFPSSEAASTGARRAGYAKLPNCQRSLNGRMCR
jgi:hypothetical protein